MLEYVEYLADVLTFGEAEQRDKLTESLLKDGTITNIKKCLEQAKKKEVHHGQELIKEKFMIVRNVHAYTENSHKKDMFVRMYIAFWRM